MLCLNCGLIYQNPSLDKESLFHIYDTIEYWNHKESGRKDSYMHNYFSYLSEKNQEWMHRKQSGIKVVTLSENIS